MELLEGRDLFERIMIRKKWILTALCLSISLLMPLPRSCHSLPCVTFTVPLSISPSLSLSCVSLFIHSHTLTYTHYHL